MTIVKARPPPKPDFKDPKRSMQKLVKHARKDLSMSLVDISILVHIFVKGRPTTIYKWINESDNPHNSRTPHPAFVELLYLKLKQKQDKEHE